MRWVGVANVRKTEVVSVGVISVATDDDVTGVHNAFTNRASFASPVNVEGVSFPWCSCYSLWTSFTLRSFWSGRASRSSGSSRALRTFRADRALSSIHTW